VIYFPEEEETLVKVLDALESRADGVRRVRIPEWVISRVYLSGVRNFTSIDYGRGTVRYRYDNRQGRPPFRNETLLRDLQIELGRFLGIDIRPSVKMKGWGLDRMRQAAMAQVTLDHEVPEAMLARMRTPFFEGLMTYGMHGVAAWVQDAGFLSGTSMIDLVPPWELLPVPYNATSPETALGVMRTRVLSLEWLKRTPAWDRLKRKQDDLQVMEVDWGAMYSGAVDRSGVVGDIMGLVAGGLEFSASQSVGGAPADAKYEEFRKFVKVSELWLKNPDNLVRRYVLRAGRVVGEDQDYEKAGKDVFFPLGLPRYYPIGFYGRSYIGPMVPSADRDERAMDSLYRNLEELDLLGLLAVPTTLGLSDSAFQMRDRPKRAYYEPDPMAPQVGISQIAPVATGTYPQQVMGMGTTYHDKMAGQSPLYQGTNIGRVDSMAGMGFTLETNQVGIEAVGNSIADALSAVYMALLAAARQRLTKQDMMRVTNLDTMIVGVVLNSDGTVSLTDNPIPDPRDVVINIRSRTPPSQTQEIQQMVQAMQLGIIDDREFRLLVYRKGLQFPVGHEDEFQAWRKARLNIRQVFNDGKTPGTRIDENGQRILAAHPDLVFDIHDIHIREIRAFAAGPEFSMADPAVQNAFVDLLESFENLRGQQFPPQLPYPEEMPGVSGPSPAGGPPGGAPGVPG
jgi:hypothetical protein